MGDIGPRHVAANQYGVGVVRTNRRVEHRSAAAGANDPEITRARVATISQQDCSNGKSKKEQDHLFLFFAFVTIASLSFWQKVFALSILLKGS